MKCKFYLSLSLLFSTPLFSMQRDAAKTSMQMINSVLASYSDLYEFNQDAKFQGSGGVDARLSELKQRKLARVTEEIIHKIDDKLKKLRAENTIAVGKHAISREAVSRFFTATLLPALAYVIDYRSGPATPPNASKKMVEYAQCSHGQALRDRKIAIGIGAAHAFSETCLLPHRYEEEERSLVAEREDILFALEHDPLNSDEERVMRAWHTMPKAMQKTVTNALLARRNETGKDARTQKDIIDHCLRLPTTYKRLFPEHQGTTAEFILLREQFLDEKFSAAPWTSYSQNTRQQLRLAIAQIVNEAEKSHGGKNTRRIILFFHGPPGSGKSFAAREIAKLLKLPSMTLPFTSSEDFSESNLFGNAAYTDPRLGKIFRVLFLEDEQGCVFRNPVAIIEEFDRLLKKGHVPSSVLTFLDPDNKKRRADYFGKDVEVDIGGIVTILTANTDLGKDKSAKAEEDDDDVRTSGSLPQMFDQLEALRDRFIFVHFDGFVDDNRRTLLKAYIEDSSLLEFSPCFASRDCTTITQDIVDYVFTKFPNASTREAQRKADALANTKKDLWHTIK